MDLIRLLLWGGLLISESPCLPIKLGTSPVSDCSFQMCFLTNQVSSSCNNKICCSLLVYESSLLFFDLQ